MVQPNTAIRLTYEQRLEAVCGNLGRTDAILGAAAAHHPLL